MDNQQGNYTLYLTFSQDGRVYLGVKKDIDDTYFGSFKDKTFIPLGRSDLLSGLTMEEAFNLESEFITELNAIKSNKFVNNSVTGLGQIQTLTSEARLKKSKSLKDFYSTEEGKQVAKERALKTAETRMEKGSYDFKNNQSFIRNQRLGKRKRAVESGTMGNGRVISEETFSRYVRELTEAGIDFNPADFIGLKSEVSQYYGLVRSLKSLIRKIETKTNAYGRVLTEKEIKVCVIALNDYLEREYREVPGNVEQLLKRAEDIVCSYGKP
jgi:hypothetical protein